MYFTFLQWVQKVCRIDQPSTSAQSLITDAENSNQNPINKVKITIDDVRKMQNNKNFKSFDEFIAHIFSIHTMVFENVADWYKGKCSCPAYSKHNICKHILCVAYRTSVLPPPDHLIKQVETPAPKKPSWTPQKGHEGFTYRLEFCNLFDQIGKIIIEVCSFD